MARRAVLAVLLAACASAASAQTSPGVGIGVDEARRIIAEGNREWGRARVALDTKTFERMLTPDFYVQLPDRRLTRAQFLERISSFPPGARLTRFDADVLTVQPSSDGWVAVIREKLEYTPAEAKAPKIYSLWITRDAWKQVEGRWMIGSSEAIGTESWRDGAVPPFRDW